MNDLFTRSKPSPSLSPFRVNDGQSVESILPVKVAVTSVTRLNFDGEEHDDGDKVGTCKQTFWIRPTHQKSIHSAFAFCRQETLRT